MTGYAQGPERVDRIVEAAMAILQAAPGQELNIVVLNKQLFYLDLHCLAETGQTATGSPYIALEKGPVIAGYQRKLVDALRERNLAAQRKEAVGDYEAKPVKVLKPFASYRYLDTRAIEAVKQIAAQFQRWSSTQVSRFSHDNAGWATAWETFQSGGKPDIDMNLAMQQIMEDDEWLNSEADEKLLEAFQQAARAIPR
jgi:uncharacterized phage-associated protein